MSRFKDKRVFLVRHGAYGDVIHCSHLPRLFKAYGAKEVKVETNRKGMQIFHQNPYIDKLQMLDQADPRWATRTYNWILKHIEAEGEGYDFVFNLDNTLERGYIAMEDMNEYYMGTEKRRQLYGAKNYYDISSEVCGFEERGVTGEVYFSSEEERHTSEYLKRYEDKTKVLMNLSGSSPQKVFVYWKGVVEKILNEYPDSVIWVTGDQDCKKELESSVYNGHERIRKVAATWTFRQTLCFAKYADLVISPESGLAVGSNAFGTPTVQMLTTTSIINHPVYAQNDFSIQSAAKCSPCHKGPYQFIGCHKKNNLPICTFFDPETVMNQVRKALSHERIAV